LPKIKIFSPVRTALPVRLGIAGSIAPPVNGEIVTRSRQRPERSAPMHTVQAKLSRRAFVATSIASGAAVVAHAVPTQSRTRSPDMETTIRTDADLTTLINVFSVDAENQPKLVELLKDGTENVFSKSPGWISTNLLSSKDGRRVVIYSQWRSSKDIEAFRQNPALGPYFQRITALAKFEAFECDVPFVLHA
jgi:quinol monooxygenase YgiN